MRDTLRNGETHPNLLRAAVIAGVPHAVRQPSRKRGGHWRHTSGQFWSPATDSYEENLDVPAEFCCMFAQLSCGIDELIANSEGRLRDSR